MQHTRLINYVLYQVGWFACVLGAASQQPWAGFLVATLLMGVHLVLCEDRSVEFRLVLMATVIGGIVESAEVAVQTYRFPSGSLGAGLPPLWLLAMWAQFATTFRFSLRSVMMRPWRAALFGAAGGPIAFLAGERLGAVVLARPLGPGLLRLSVSWMIALVIMSVVVRGTAQGQDAPRYRVSS